MSTTTPHASSSAKVLFSGRSRTSSGPAGATRSEDGFVDLKLPEPHPAAEKLFASAWGACYLGALELAASQRKVKLPSAPAVDVQIDLLRDASGFFLRATHRVSIPGIDRAAAEELAHAAHAICPYSKAVHGNIEVTTSLA